MKPMPLIPTISVNYNPPSRLYRHPATGMFSTSAQIRIPQHGDDLYFSGNPANKKKSPTAKTENPEQLNFFKRAVKFVMSLPLRLVPPFLYRLVERKTLYEGATKKALRKSMQVTLAEQQAEFSDAANQSVNNFYRNRLKAATKTREVTFQSDKNATHRGWYCPAEDGKPTILLSLGNAMSLRSMFSYSSLINQGYGFFTYEYPQYGKATGKINEKNIYKSLEAASDYLAEECSVLVNQQVAYGISLGGAVTTEVATRRPFKAVILESTMTRFSDVAQRIIERHIPSWIFPIHERLPSKLNSIDKIKSIQSPILILHNDGDPLMPVDFAHRLYQETPDKSKASILPLNLGEGIHVMDGEKTSPEIKAFLDGIAI